MGTHIPVVQYMRPRGLKHEGFIVVPEEFQTDQLKEKLALLVKHGIRITQEDVGYNQVNVCLDDGDLLAVVLARRELRQEGHAARSGLRRD